MHMVPTQKRLNSWCPSLVRMYHANGCLEFDVAHSEFITSSIEAFRNELRQLELFSVAAHGTEITGS